MHALKIPEPLSPIELLDGELRRAAEAVPPEITSMTELELYETGKIRQMDYFLRKNLWKSVEIAQKAGKPSIISATVYQGVCTVQNFHSKVLTNPLRVAFLLLQPGTAQEAIEEAANFGLLRLREKVMTMAINEKTVGAYVRALEFLADRAWGPVVHRIEAKHAHMDMNKPVVHDPAAALEAPIRDVTNNNKSDS